LKIEEGRVGGDEERRGWAVKEEGR